MEMEILIFVTWAKKSLKMLLLLNRVRNQIKNTNRNFSSKLNSSNYSLYIISVGILVTLITTFLDTNKINSS